MIRYDSPSRDSHGPQPGLEQLRAHVMAHYVVTDDLGIYNYRQVRGSRSLSTHAEGRAWDARFKDRAELLRAVAWVEAHVQELQVQEIIDYEGRRRWDSRTGWRPYSKAGASGATWHVARNWDGARDGRPIRDVLAGTPAVPEGEEREMWLARIKGENAVWLCDGIHRRHIGAAELDLYRLRCGEVWECDRVLVEGMSPVGGPGR